MKDVLKIFHSNVPSKTTFPNVYFAKDISMVRAFIYSLVCDSNSNHVATEALIAGCNRYGIDNPCPIINKRMSTYGISDDLDKDFKRLVEKYKKEYPDLDIDPDVYGPAEIKNGMSMEYTKPAHTFDFKETMVKSPLRKKAGILNMNLLHKDTFTSFG